jgi:IclR family KDG regulon transcriptional repressor
MEKTVAKAFKLLETLAAHDRPRRVTELSRELGLVKSNTHRLLQTMIELGYVRQTEQGLYEASIRLWELGSRVAWRVPVQRAAGDHLKRLAAASAEETHLAILDGVDVVYIQAIEAVHPVRVTPTPGRRAPLHCTAVGKAILAFQSDAMIRFAAKRLEAFTPRTITTSERLRAELAEIRRRGFAMNLGEWRAGAHGIGAPIANPDGTIGAAVSVIGPAERMPAKTMRALAPMVLEAAAAIALSLAYATASPEIPPERAAAAG